MTDGDTILHHDFVKYVEEDFTTIPNLSVMSGYVQGTKYNTITALRDIDYAIGQNIYKLAQSSLNLILVIPGCAGAFRTSLFTFSQI